MLRNPRFRRNLFKIVPFGVLWCLFSVVYLLVEYGLLGDADRYPSTGNPYDFRSAMLATPPAALVFGCLLGLAEVLFLNKLFVRRSFWQKILFKSLVYLVAIAVLLVGISLVTSGPRHGVPMFDPLVWASLQSFVGSFAFWSIVIYAGCTIVVSLYVSETSDYLGGSVFGNFFTGKYHRPIEEERIFMFLDIKASTTIAERLGHHRYFDLLDRFYADTTNAIVDTWGEVYQYAGDEVVVSWDMARGLHDNNCIRCFFLIRAQIQRHAPQYQRAFGLVPAFKAGLHCGVVTTGEIGVLKKELFFTGDVVNTAARVQSQCNPLGVDLLLSEDLASRLQPDAAFVLEPRGAFELKGRSARTRLFTLRERGGATDGTARTG